MEYPGWYGHAQVIAACRHDEMLYDLAILVKNNYAKTPFQGDQARRQADAQRQKDDAEQLGIEAADQARAVHRRHHAALAGQGGPWLNVLQYLIPVSVIAGISVLYFKGLTNGEFVAQLRSGAGLIRTLVGEITTGVREFPQVVRARDRLGIEGRGGRMVGGARIFHAVGGAAGLRVQKAGDEVFDLTHDPGERDPNPPRLLETAARLRARLAALKPQSPDDVRMAKKVMVA